MQNLAALFLLMTLAACAEPQWSGTYMGELLNSGTCSDGSPPNPPVGAGIIVLTRIGNTVTWEEQCVIANQGVAAIADIGPDDDMATVRPYECPTYNGPGALSVTGIKGTGGTLTLNGDSLRMELMRTTSGPGSVCEIQTEGELSRLEE